MKTSDFDPNSAALAGSGIFGLPYQEEESSLIYLPVPWEATTSYGSGASAGPSAILEASKQVDLFDVDVLCPYQAKLYFLPENPEIKNWNQRAKGAAQKVIAAGGNVRGDVELESALELVNQLGAKLNDSVYSETKRLTDAGKIVGIVGGDHSVPYGALKAIGEKYRSFGILHFDAHSDTRRAYEGFEWSHASIIFNVLRDIPSVIKVVQVGVRDLCEEEVDFNSLQKHRVQTFYDRDLARRKFEGIPWGQLCREMISLLPNEVWVSFDVDGLDPRFCPNTGTPVPGGLDFQEANYLLSALARSGRRIIGFDLNEVAPGPANSAPWDANVGARLLYKLSAWTLASQSKAKFL